MRESEKSSRLQPALRSVVYHQLFLQYGGIDDLSQHRWVNPADPGYAAHQFLLRKQKRSQQGKDACRPDHRPGGRRGGDRHG